MSKPLLHFFDNKVKLVLQNKQIIKGLHKSTDHDKKTITLIQVETWGNQQGGEVKTVAANTKFDEKTYDINDVLEVEFEGSRFRNQEAKKYNKDDFFDNLESSSNNTGNKFKYRDKDQGDRPPRKYNYREKRDDHNGGYRERRDDREPRQPRQPREPREPRQPQQYDRRKEREYR